jgi:hypothetical protein
MNENWKDIPGYEALYQVSDLGRVKALPRTLRFLSKRGVESWRVTAEKLCSVNVTRNGYCLVHFQVDGVRHTRTVHELVMLAFAGARPERLEINHKDGDKRNNALVNLEYVTSEQNHRHAVDTGLNKQARRVVGVRLFEDAVVFPSISRAAEFAGVNGMTIARAARMGYDVAGRMWCFA